MFVGRVVRAAVSSSVAINGSFLNVTFVDGVSYPFHKTWLRDHCQCSECRHPLTFQKLVNVFEIMKNTEIEKVDVKADSLHLTWNSQHETEFSLNWLRQQVFSSSDRTIFDGKRLWNREDVTNECPKIHFDSLMSNDVQDLRNWFDNIYKWGFCLVEGVPPTIEATEIIARKTSVIRNTHFGLMWDFCPNFEHADLAYSTSYLPLHTDSTYFSEPTGLQMFHCVEFTGKGGETILAVLFFQSFFLYFF
eukprot:Pompholyxophrys_punicea_v1_NODE_731_length_1386_cov_6.960180.p1 type:complete len:248 gc:universal NODE_731_length_1386_cov_6.960180:556-1299(+)